MGRRKTAAGSGGAFNRNVFLRHIESCDIHSPSVDQIVDHLRSTFPHYSRLKLQPLTRQVEKTLQLSNFNNPKRPRTMFFEENEDVPEICKKKITKIDDFSEDPEIYMENPTQNKRKIKKIDDFSDDPEIYMENSTQNKKKLRKNGDFSDDPEIYMENPAQNKKKMRKNGDLREERLQLLEEKHLDRMRVENESLTGTTDEESDGDDDDESSSEDGIYGDELEPKIDLMKDILREKYIDKVGSGVKGNGKEWKELEMVSNSDGVVRKKVELVKRRKRGVELVSKNREESERNLGGSRGPMFKDLGGMNGVIEELTMEIIVPLYHPQLARHLGVKPMGGILLNGPPGCGKTKLANAIANETGVPFYSISATELVSGISGASEENIRELFSKAYRTAPSIVFIDEIDAIASKRENMQREMERRIVTQLMTCMDESHKPVQPSAGNALPEDAGSQPGYVLVIGATNRPDAVDPALRRPGRFDREITLGVPDGTARIDILSRLTDKLKLEGSFDLEKIARSTPGFVGADLAALTYKAGNLALKRLFDQRKSQLRELNVEGEHAEDWWRQPWSPEEIGKLSITMTDFEEAVKHVQPSSRREGFSAIPNVKWEDVGGLDMLRLEFDRHIVQSIKNPKLYADFGINTEIGFLLYGPPGCGKTLIAKAVANEAGANFIHIKGPELLNKYVGESELAVRTIFSRARTCSPCVLFFDEVDALTTQRGREGGQVVERLVTQLLIELDGAEKRKGVFVIGATNRPEIMDPAFLRPGRFGKLLYVPLPSPDERGMILKALARKKPIDANVNLMAIAKDGACGNLSGADLSALLNEAAMAAVQEEQTSGDGSISSPRTIKDNHFKVALQKIAPSVSDKQRKHYDLLSQRFGICLVHNKSEGKEKGTGYVYLEQSQPKP